MHTTRTGSSSFYLPGKTGALLPLDRPKQWSREIQHLRADPLDRERLRETAHDWVKINFDSQINAKRVLAAQIASGV